MAFLGGNRTLAADRQRYAAALRSSYEQIENEWAKLKSDFKKKWAWSNHALIFVIQEGGYGLSNEDATDLVSEIEDITPRRKHIDVIVHSPGGGAVASDRVAEVLVRRPHTTAFVPFYAWSGGTEVALATQKIFMAKGATLGPMDVQMWTQQWGEVSARTIVETARRQGDKADTALIIAAAEAEKYMAAEARRACARVNASHKPPWWSRRERCALAKTLTDGSMPHSQGVDLRAARKLGINAKSFKPKLVSEIVNKRRGQLRRLRELKSQITVVHVGESEAVE